ncbi:ATPase, T2SS/T4P/T4SS family [Sphingomonas sp. M1-B02]|uniref:ATPase, T2SS/T4P/T4SS family n=1 Tax=Sphingomonas sp. M1-B02 TaxID=3114300 RepID=UPI0022403A77|nr:hypothetical protein [Sphingomonas sp. S6-11]UZK66467.1 hypothetical protein OKW87_01090 [Sphingomonas sp. S6-11]
MQVEAEVKRAPADPLSAYGFSAALRSAIDRATTRPTGLIAVAGAHAEETIALLASELDAEPGTVDAPGAIDAAECRRVVARAEGSDVITTILALRRQARDRFALAATLRLVIAQRSAPGLCAECRRPMQAFGSMSALLGLDPGAILWSAPGCGACDGSGEQGRVLVFEGVEIDAAMRRLIYDGADAPLLSGHAFRSAPNFASAARALARDGLIAPEAAVLVSRG